MNQNKIFIVENAQMQFPYYKRNKPPDESLHGQKIKQLHVEILEFS